MDGEFLSRPAAAGVLDLHEPAIRRLPLVLASPHSGSQYPADFVAGRGSIRWPCANPRTALSTSCSPLPRSSAPRCCRPAFRGLISTSTERLTSSTRRCSATPCPATSMRTRRGFASGSARSPASLPAARTSMPKNCALPMPSGASSALYLIFPALSLTGNYLHGIQQLLLQPRQRKKPMQ